MLKIKDWIKQKQGKAQFVLDYDTITEHVCAKRLSDGRKFYMGQCVEEGLDRGTQYWMNIGGFCDDLIHITLHVSYARELEEDDEQIFEVQIESISFKN